MNAIAVVDDNWSLGIDGKLLVHLPGDLRYFKEKTLGKTIIIGRRTFESMSCKLLPGRETVILSKNIDCKPGCLVFHSVEEVLDYVKSKPEDEVFIAGGENIYRAFFPYYKKIFITRLYATFTADRFFPNVGEMQSSFMVSNESELMEENGIQYRFIEYMRKI